MEGLENFGQPTNFYISVQQLKGGGLMSHCPKSVSVASAEVFA